CIGRVRRAEVDREQEGSIAVRLDEPQALVYEQVGQGSLKLLNLASDFQLRIQRGVGPTAEAEELIVTLPGRVELVAVPQMPLAEQHGRVACPLQNLRPAQG